MPYNDKMPTDKMPKGIKCPAVTKYLYRQDAHGDKMPSSDKITLRTKCPQNFSSIPEDGKIFLSTLPMIFTKKILKENSP